jgi:hypothetical protein
MLAGCHGGASVSTSNARASASAFATSTAAKADEAHAQALLKPCIATGHIVTAESCLKAEVPKAQRAAFGTCLAEASLRGWTYVKDVGAQACLAKVGQAPASAIANVPGS